MQIALLISTTDGPGARKAPLSDGRQAPPAPPIETVNYTDVPEAPPYPVEESVPIEISAVGGQPLAARAVASRPGTRVALAVLADQAVAAPNDRIDLDLAILHGERRAALGGYDHVHTSPSCPFCAMAAAKYGHA